MIRNDRVEYSGEYEYLEDASVVAIFRISWLVLLSKLPDKSYKKDLNTSVDVQFPSGGSRPPFDEQRALKGLYEMDALAITAIHNHFYPDIYRFAQYRLNNTHLAEDVAAEVFMRLLEAVNEGRGPRTTLRGWLMATAANMVNDHYRKSYRRKTEDLSDDLRSNTPGPMARVEIREQNKTVQAAMRNLTPDQQNILSLRFGASYSLEETAEAIGKNVNAVKQLQFRALAALRRYLGDEVP